MVLCIFGESCTGKSTLADALKVRLGPDTELYSGKDYLRLAKGEAEAEQKFRALLSEKAAAPGALIWVVSDKPQLLLLPPESVRVRMTAPLEVIKERFAKRTGGHLPPPVASMLEKKHGMFDDLPCEVSIASGEQSAEEDVFTVLRACGR